MKHITSAAFIAAITTSPSLFCGIEVVNNLDVDTLVAWMEQIGGLNPSGYDLRTVTSRHATFLEFSDGSRLYLTPGALYFRRGAALAVVIQGPMKKVILYRLAS